MIFTVLAAHKPRPAGLCRLSMVWSPVSEDSCSLFCKEPPINMVPQCEPTQKNPASSGRSSQTSYGNGSEVRNTEEQRKHPYNCRNVQKWMNEWINK